MSALLDRESIVRGLIAAGVPREKAEREAARECSTATNGVDTQTGQYNAPAPESTGGVGGASSVRAAKREAQQRAAETVRRIFFAQLTADGLPLPEYEYRFHDTREWRFDYAWPTARVALEVDGGIWIDGGGRHTRGTGWLADTEKLNAAAALGWRLLRSTPEGLHEATMIALIRRTLTPLPPAA